MTQALTIIRPLTIEKQRQVIDETHAYIKQADRIFNINKPKLDIVFNLKGRAAGMYRIQKNIFHQKREIRYNSFIFSKYFSDNLETTVPHEVAHYVSDVIYGLKNIKPHGKEWKEIMSAFGADASVTADYDLSGIPQRKTSSYTYRCDCGDKQLSTIRHNKINGRHYRYYCKICKQTLQYKGGSVV